MICKLVLYQYFFYYEYGPHQGDHMEIIEINHDRAKKQLEDNLRHIWHYVGWNNVSYKGAIQLKLKEHPKRT